MDISLLIWADESAEGAYSVGDIVDVSPRHNDPCDHPRFVLIHVDGLPALNFARVKKHLEGRSTVFVATGSRHTQRNRRWRTKADRMSGRDRNALARNRSIEVDWATARTFMIRKVVTDEADPSTDTEVLITEADLV